jgi:hypothetical protein
VVMSGTGRGLVGGDWSVQRWALAALAEWSQRYWAAVRELSAATSGGLWEYWSGAGGDVGDWSEYWWCDEELVGDWSVQRWCLV